MFIKYIVKKGDQAVVVKFDLRNNFAQVGGYTKFVELITTLLEDQYLGKKVGGENSHSQRNKLRYTGKFKNVQQFIEVMEKVKEDFDVEKVKRVERLI